MEREPEKAARIRAFISSCFLFLTQKGPSLFALLSLRRRSFSSIVIGFNQQRRTIRKPETKPASLFNNYSYGNFPMTTTSTRGAAFYERYRRLLHGERFAPANGFHQATRLHVCNHRGRNLLIKISKAQFSGCCTLMYASYMYILKQRSIKGRELAKVMEDSRGDGNQPGTRYCCWPQFGFTFNYARGKFLARMMFFGIFNLIFVIDGLRLCIIHNAEVKVRF